ncbi:hypothetical protein Efla_000254 [Eimeria flavescens]
MATSILNMARRVAIKGSSKPRLTQSLLEKSTQGTPVKPLHSSWEAGRSLVDSVPQGRSPCVYWPSLPRDSRLTKTAVRRSRCAATMAAASSLPETRGSSGGSRSFAGICGLLRVTKLQRRMGFRFRNLKNEEWILLLLSLGWGGLLAGTGAFNAWRVATREARHPYFAEAVSTLQSDKRLKELLGQPIEVKAVEEHSEAFAPWKRLTLQLRGPKGVAKGFVSARRVGYGEDDLFEQVPAEEDEGPIWSRPYVLKQWLLQGISNLGNLLRQLLAFGDKPNSGLSSEVGHWTIDTLFVLSHAGATPEAADPQDTSAVITCKGHPADNPDFYRWLPSKQSKNTLSTHWLANLCLLFLCLYSARRVRTEWRMAKERVSLSCNWLADASTQHHRHLQQLASRQLQEASKKSYSSAAVSLGDQKAVQAEVRMTYFTGQLSREAIDGVAHLEIQGEEEEVDVHADPDVADKLQCELSKRRLVERLAVRLPTRKPKKHSSTSHHSRKGGEHPICEATERSSSERQSQRISSHSDSQALEAAR